ncbi:hypothetical protein B5X24_HaOG214990 [Helicoverpa armigera]|nr:hypothetical protein B5X24_HaOG214990 [Helicoverpa armigera]
MLKQFYNFLKLNNNSGEISGIRVRKFVSRTNISGRTIWVLCCQILGLRFQYWHKKMFGPIYISTVSDLILKDSA